MSTALSNGNSWAWAVGRGAGTAVAGFGVMAALSRWGNYPSELRDLYSYRAATWGDGILLPIAAGALAMAIEALPAHGHEKVLVRIGFLTGAVCGAAIQALWLLDPAPRVNWTLPVAHHFNSAGWYHAVFLVGASGMFAALWTRLGLRLLSARTINPLAVASTLVAGLSSAGFVALASADNSAQGANSATSALSTLGALAGSVTALAVGAAWVALQRIRSRRLEAAQQVHHEGS